MSGQVSEREPNYGAMTTLHIRRKDGDIVLRMDVDDTKHPNFRLILEPDHYEAVVRKRYQNSLCRFRSTIVARRPYS